MLAPARMAAVVAARVALPRACGGKSGGFVADGLVAGEMVRANVRPRNDLREMPARMG